MKNYQDLCKTWMKYKDEQAQLRNRLRSVIQEFSNQLAINLGLNGKTWDDNGQTTPYILLGYQNEESEFIPLPDKRLPPYQEDAANKTIFMPFQIALTLERDAQTYPKEQITIPCQLMAMKSEYLLLIDAVDNGRKSFLVQIDDPESFDGAIEHFKQQIIQYFA